VIAASDIEGAVTNPDGLDVAKLIDFQQEHPLNQFPGGAPMIRDELLGVDCDVLIPAAQPDVLDRATAPQVRARIVLEGANIPATAEAEQVLAARDVLVVPDIIANSGGVICAAAESRGLTAAQAFTDIAARLRTAMADWLDRTASGQTPRNAARMMAQERLRAASVYRRTF
jgi:glutamate dehydrogenase/leucine dehydrogenase